MSRAMRNFVLQQKRGEADAPGAEQLEEKRGMMRGGSRGAFRSMNRAAKRNSNRYGAGKIGHAAFNSRFNRINKARSYLIKRGRRPGNRRVRFGDVR